MSPNGLLLPAILVFMLLLINDRRIMGDYTNGPLLNGVAWLTVGILSFLSLATIGFSLFGA